MIEFSGLDELAAIAGGTFLGHGEWRQISQRHVHAFAEVTGDSQWIHVDSERASFGPFGTTIAHGYLTLSLLPALAREVYLVENVAMAINYGLERVRFITPVRTGSRVRAAVTVVETTPLSGALRVVTDVGIELEGAKRPACVARAITQYYAH